MHPTKAEVSSLRCDVLDDDAAVREVICGILSRNRVSYRSFATLEAQLAAMAAHHPDLLFLDVKLAREDAVDAVQRLHGMGYEGQIQVVSGLDPRRLSDIYAMMERYGYGSLYPIGKPFRSAAISAVLQHVCAELAAPAREKAVPSAGLVAGWLVAPDAKTRALVVQPHLAADPQKIDLLANADQFGALIASIAAAALEVRQESKPEIWVHMSLGAALGLPLAMMLGPPSNAVLSIVVPIEQAMVDPRKFGDLRTRLSVYGVGSVLFVDRLDQIMMSRLSGAAPECLIFDSNCVDQMIGGATNRLLAERIVSSCQALGICLVAMCTRAEEGQEFLASLGVRCFADPTDQMRLPDELRLAPYRVEHKATGAEPATLVPLQDFPGSNLLSEREAEIVKLTVNGLSAKEAGRAVNLSYRTVEVHRSNVFAKLGVKNVAQLTKLVLGTR